MDQASKISRVVLNGTACIVFPVMVRVRQASTVSNYVIVGREESNLGVPCAVIRRNAVHEEHGITLPRFSISETNLANLGDFQT